MARPRKAGSGAAVASQSIPMEKFVDEVKQRAYENYLQRGNKPGASLTDWLQAEKEIKAKYGIKG